MEWSLPETVTAGSVIFAALAIVFAIVKQRTDPKLLELMRTQTDLLRNQDDNNSRDNERFAASYDKNTAAIDALSKSFDAVLGKINSTFEGIEKRSNEQYTANMRLIEKLIGHVSGEHDTIQLAVNSASGQLRKHNEEQQRQFESLEGIIKTNQEQSEGLQQVMVKATETQAKTNGDILSLLKEIKDELKSIRQSSAAQYGETLERLNKTNLTVANIEKRLSKQTGNAKPTAPLPQSSIPPKPIVTIKKTTINDDQPTKDKSND